jgi:hypothetical protein
MLAGLTYLIGDDGCQPALDCLPCQRVVMIDDVAPLLDP